MAFLRYTPAFIFPLLGVISFYAGGFYNFSVIILAFVILPLIDQFFGPKPIVYSNDERRKLEHERAYSFLIQFWVLVQLSYLFWAASAYVNLDHWLYKTGLILGTGTITGAIGITLAHELGHKKSSWERNLSKVLLMTVCYMHFYIEHNRGHHVYVGTPADPATARRDENVYAFWWRSVTQSFIHAWKLEKSSLEKKNLPVLSRHNQMLHFVLLPIVFLAMLIAFVYFMKGIIYWEIAVFFFAQSFVAFSLLEIVNYVEHYGLSRKKMENGRFEPVSDFHSWNSDFYLSNLVLFQLQLHTDHHKNAIKRYQALESVPNSPQLPGGYPAMMLATLMPTLWKKKIHPLLEEYAAKRNLNRS